MARTSACATDVMAFDPVSEEVREAMMIAMTGTLQHAAIECAEICLQRLQVLHGEMLRRFDEAQRQASAQRLAVLKNFDDATLQACALMLLLVAACVLRFSQLPMSFLPATSL